MVFFLCSRARDMSSAFPLHSVFAPLPFIRLLASVESHKPILVARKRKAGGKRRWLPSVAVTDLCAIAPDCQAVVLALAPGCLHILCTQSHQLLAFHRLVPAGDASEECWNTALAHWGWQCLTSAPCAQAAALASCKPAPGAPCRSGPDRLSGPL